jgi:hypothetical protein
MLEIERTVDAVQADRKVALVEFLGQATEAAERARVGKLRAEKKVLLDRNGKLFGPLGFGFRLGAGGGGCGFLGGFHRGKMSVGTMQLFEARRRSTPLIESHCESHCVSPL